MELFEEIVNNFHLSIIFIKRLAARQGPKYTSEWMFC